MPESTIPERAAVTLPEYPGANANMGVALSGETAKARRWTTDTGVQVVSLMIGMLVLTVTPEQWVAIKDTVDAVLPVQVSA